MSDTVANLASLLFLGFFLGMRHATDADHVVAIATIVSRQRTLRGSALIGGAWGVGHTLTILVVGGAIILFGVVIPARVGLAMEFAVGIMLVLLGLLTLTGMSRVIREAAGARTGMAMHAHDHSAHAYPHEHAHAHGDYVHQHAHGHGADAHGHRDDQTPLARMDRRLGGLTLYQWLRPLVVGIVHGLAGSAAVALLVLAAVRDPAWAMAYLLLFGAGTIIGMMVITMALAAPFAFSWTRLPRFNWQLRVASGLISFGFGLLLIYDIGFAAGGLFTADAELATALTMCSGSSSYSPTCLDVAHRLSSACFRLTSGRAKPNNAATANRLVEGSIQSIRLPHASALLLGGIIVVLLAVVAYAVQREFAAQPAGNTAAPAVSSVPARALSAEEEAYAAALWSIHREVKLAALGMTFAGIAYKTDSQDRATLQAKVEPLTQVFRTAIADARALEVPVSVRDVHERYLGALASYETASEEMVQTAQDGRDEHLIEAQGMSFRASEDTLRVGDVLWPGEYKPH